MDENILLRHTPTGIPVITDRIGKADNAVFMIAVGTGSRDEDTGTEGISHLLEHVVFRATKTRTSFQMSKEIEGAGGEMNAFTGKEVTAFYAATIKETAAVAKEMVSDVFLNPLIKAEDVELEKKIVLQEISMWENDPESYIHRVFAETMWDGHDLSRNEAGSIETVRSLTADDLKKYHEERYKAPNIAVFALGAVDPDDALSWTSDTFDGSGAGKRVERTAPGKTRPAYRFSERKGDHSYTGFGFRAYPANHADIAALTVLNTILGGGMSSRLFQRIREENALVYSVFSTIEQDSDAGSLSVYMSSTKENVIKSITECASVCRELRDEGLIKGELERAKNLIKGAGSRQLESTVNRSYRMTRRFMLTGRPESFTERMNALDAVSEEDVMRVASDVISEKNLAVAVYGTKNRDIKRFSIDRVGL